MSSRCNPKGAKLSRLPAVADYSIMKYISLQLLPLQNTKMQNMLVMILKIGIILKIYSYRYVK